MVRGIDSQAGSFLKALERVNERVTQLQEQVASGKRLRASSDAPDKVSHLLSARADLARLEQTATNLSLVRTELDTAEQSLQAAVKLFDRVRTLGQTGASFIQTAESRRIMADELAAIEERMAGLANTEVMGRFLFSGDTDGVPPYTLDWNATPPWSAYGGAPSTRQVEHPTGLPFRIAETAAEIFENTAPNRNVFQTIETLRQALLASDVEQIVDALAPLAEVSLHLNAKLGFYGNALNQVHKAGEDTIRMKLRLEIRIAETEDADVVAAMVELQQLKFQEQAALETRAATPRRSLFDYLR